MTYTAFTLLVVSVLGVLALAARPRLSHRSRYFLIRIDMAGFAASLILVGVCFYERGWPGAPLVGTLAIALGVQLLLWLVGVRSEWVGDRHPRLTAPEPHEEETTLTHLLRIYRILRSLREAAGPPERRQSEALRCLEEVAMRLHKLASEVDAQLSEGIVGRGEISSIAKHLHEEAIRIRLQAWPEGPPEAYLEQEQRRTDLIRKYREEAGKIDEAIVRGMMKYPELEDLYLSSKEGNPFRRLADIASLLGVASLPQAMELIPEIESTLVFLTKHTGFLDGTGPGKRGVD